MASAQKMIRGENEIYSGADSPSPLSHSCMPFSNVIQQLSLCYGPDFEVQSDQWEHQTLQVLDQIVERAQPHGVFAVVDLDQTSDLAGREWHVVTATQNL